MRWKKLEDKRFHLVRVLASAKDELLSRSSPSLVNHFLGVLSKLSPESETTPSIPSALLLCEEPAWRSINLDINKLLSNPELVLTEQSISVGALDSSYHSATAHFKISYFIINVGYWYANYQEQFGGEGMHTKLSTTVKGNLEQRILTKEEEVNAAVKIIDEIGDSSIRFIFLDEALSQAYTLSWAKNLREKIVSLTTSFVKKLMEYKTYPIGIFYTRSSDLVRGVVFQAGLAEEDFVQINDRTIMENWLPDGARSPLLKVHSKPLLGKDLNLLCFYLKIGGGNILRIEFPHELKKYVDLIHSAVLAQAILGNGYPLCLQRAHDIAVLSKDDRILIEGEIARILGIPTPELLLSKKEVGKRWSIT